VATRYIEILGRPNSGKTSLVSAMQRWLVSAGQLVRIVPEAATRAPMGSLKRDWRFNAWTSLRTIEGLLDAEAGTEIAIALLDRGLVDALCWLEWHRRRNSIPPDVYQALAATVRAESWWKLTGTLIWLDCSYPTAQSRNGGEGRIVNPETFRELGQIYEDLVPSTMKTTVRVTTDHLETTEVLQRVLEAVAFDPLPRP
jgi:hypothetical protein